MEKMNFNEEFSCHRCKHQEKFESFLSHDSEDPPGTYLVICPNCEVLIDTYEDDSVIEDEYFNNKKYTVDCSREVKFIIGVIAYLFQQINNPVVEKFLEHSLIDLKYHPLVPKNNIRISFKNNDTNYFLYYSDYKIELSDYVTEWSDYGSDHFQRFKFIFTPEGLIETEGIFELFEEEFWHALHTLPVSDISIGTEE